MIGELLLGLALGGFTAAGIMAVTHFVVWLLVRLFLR